MSENSKTTIPLTSDEARRVTKIADMTAKRLIAGETLRLALPISRLIHEKVFANYKSIETKYGKVE